MDIFFSIVIPVYNVAPYLHACLDSVLAQTFTEWEAICVDDGSTDGSEAILDEYATKDSRFKVIHQKNAGVSVARQRGMEEAKGRYLVWADSDDRMDSGFLECFHSASESGGYDFIWCDCYEEKDGAASYSTQAAPEEAQGYVRKLLNGDVWGSLWNKAVSRDFVMRNKVSFPDGGCKIMEDVCFVLGLMSKNPSMRYVVEAHYGYVIRGGSLVRAKKSEELFSRCVESERYVQKAAEYLGPDFKEVLEKRKKGLMFGMYSNPEISDELFYGAFPEVCNLRGIGAPLWHRLLYPLAVKGHRRIVLSLFKLLRKIK